MNPRVSSVNEVQAIIHNSLERLSEADIPNGKSDPIKRIRLSKTHLVDLTLEGSGRDPCG